jgi:murein DD-endopeptidase MepM/ murein hydrolase activator NlpD
MQRFHPVQHRWKAHKGTDYAVPEVPISTTASGVVENGIYGRKWKLCQSKT